MTWGEFKDWMETQGVKDDDEIWYIDVTDDPREVLSSDIGIAVVD